MSENNISENKVYEITKLMQNPDNLRKDMKEALEIVTEHFRNKYIAPVEREIKCCSEACRKEHVKEIALLEACRPFVKKTDGIDLFINIINSINVIDKLTPIKVRAAKLNDSSIHKDGIYDIDESCSVSKLNTDGLIGGINPILIVVIIILMDAI